MNKKQGGGTVNGELTRVMMEFTELAGGSQRNMITPNTRVTPLSWEHWADIMTVAIAGRARRLYPDDIKARATWFDARIDALPKPWKLRAQS